MKPADYARLVLLAAIWGGALPATALAGGILILAGTVLVTRS